MSDAAKARAEARKKAILAGRTNRLAKLTSTARGEEAAAAFIREGASWPLSLSNRKLTLSSVC
jgi:hypothetical protein